MRATLLVIAALTIGLLLAACGSSGDKTQSVGGVTVTIPTDAHGDYPELEAILAQFPYQGWYSKCVLTRVKKNLSPKEAEELEQNPEWTGAAKAREVISTASADCEKSSKRPLIDPNASEGELAVYRASLVEGTAKLAESKGFKSPGVECVEAKVEELPGGKVVGLGNGTPAVREGILLSVLAQCVKAE